MKHDEVKHAGACANEDTNRLDVDVRDADVTHVTSSVALLETNSPRRVTDRHVADVKVLEGSVVAPPKVNRLEPGGSLWDVAGG